VANLHGKILNKKLTNKTRQRLQTMKNEAQLNHAIALAYEALEEIDNFDLDSDDPKSVAELKKLEKEHHMALKFVIKLAKRISDE
jgi:hypothetical protein